MATTTFYNGTYIKDGKRIMFPVLSTAMSDPYLNKKQSQINSELTSTVSALTNGAIYYNTISDNAPEPATSEIDDTTTSLSSTWSSEKINSAIGKGIYHSVLDYGAVGDGVTDDTGAFNNCIKTAIKDGMNVFIPAGKTYSITGSIKVENAVNMTILCQGTLTVVSTTGSTSAFTFTGCNNVVFKYGVLNATAASSNRTAFTITASSNINIENVVLNGFACDIITKTNTTDATTINTNIRITDVVSTDCTKPIVIEDASRIYFDRYQCDMESTSTSTGFMIGKYTDNIFIKDSRIYSIGGKSSYAIYAANAGTSAGNVTSDNYNSSSDPSNVYIQNAFFNNFIHGIYAKAKTNIDINGININGVSGSSDTLFDFGEWAYLNATAVSSSNFAYAFNPSIKSSSTININDSIINTIKESFKVSDTASATIDVRSSVISSSTETISMAGASTTKAKFMSTSFVCGSSSCAFNYAASSAPLTLLNCSVDKTGSAVSIFNQNATTSANNVAVYNLFATSFTKIASSAQFSTMNYGSIIVSKS